MESRLRPYRWLKRLEEAPAGVVSVWADPPELSLANRADLLRELRRTMAAHGYEIARVRKLFFRHRVLAQGPAATALVEAQEQRADTRGHWWIDHVIWRSDRDSVVVCVADPDGYDLHFLGWGDDVTDCLQALESVMAARPDDAP